VLFLAAASAQRTCRHRALPGSGEAELPGSGPRCRTRRIRFYRRFRLSRLHARSSTVRVFRGRYRGRCAKLVRRGAAERVGHAAASDGVSNPGFTCLGCTPPRATVGSQLRYLRIRAARH